MSNTSKEKKQKINQKGIWFAKDNTWIDWCLEENTDKLFEYSIENTITKLNPDKIFSLEDDWFKIFTFYENFKKNAYPFNIDWGLVEKFYAGVYFEIPSYKTVVKIRKIEEELEIPDMLNIYDGLVVNSLLIWDIKKAELSVSSSFFRPDIFF